MQLKSMKRSKTESEPEVVEAKSDEDRYPYGLELHLDKEAIDKLGIDCDVGDVVMIEAKAKVTGKYTSASESGEHKTMNLQITDMAAEKPSTAKSTTDALYGGDE